MNEVWNQIKDYEGLYEASNMGNIRSLVQITKWGTPINRIKVLKPIFDRRYLAIGLVKNGKPKKHKVHRLVLSSFTEKYDDLTVNHINGIKTDNRLENLEWCTQSQNNSHDAKEILLKIAKNIIKNKIK